MYCNACQQIPFSCTTCPISNLNRSCALNAFVDEWKFYGRYEYPPKQHEFFTPRKAERLASLCQLIGNYPREEVKLVKVANKFCKDYCEKMVKEINNDDTTNCKQHKIPLTENCQVPLNDENELYNKPKELTDFVVSVMLRKHMKKRWLNNRQLKGLCQFYNTIVDAANRKPTKCENLPSKWLKDYNQLYETICGQRPNKKPPMPYRSNTRKLLKQSYNVEIPKHNDQPDQKLIELQELLELKSWNCEHNTRKAKRERLYKKICNKFFELQEQSRKIIQTRNSNFVSEDVDVIQQELQKIISPKRDTRNDIFLKNSTKRCCVKTEEEEKIKALKKALDYMKNKYSCRKVQCLELNGYCPIKVYKKSYGNDLGKLTKTLATKNKNGDTMRTPLSLKDAEEVDKIKRRKTPTIKIIKPDPDKFYARYA